MIEKVNNKIFAHNPNRRELDTIIGRFNYVRPKHIHIIFDLNYLISNQVLVSMGYYEKYDRHWLAYLFDAIKPFLRDTENVVNPNKDTHITFTLISNKTKIPLKELVEIWMRYYNIKPSNQFSYFVQPSMMFNSSNYNLFYQIFLDYHDKFKSKYYTISKDEYQHRLDFATSMKERYLKDHYKEENNNV